MSLKFVRITWFIDYVPKSLVKSIRTDVAQYLVEEKEYYLKEFAKEVK